MSIANREPEIVNAQADAYARSLGFKDAREMDEDWALANGYDNDVPDEDYMDHLREIEENEGLPF